MNARFHLQSVFAIASLTACVLAGVETPSRADNLPAANDLRGLALLDLSGNVHRLSESDGHRATALVFLSAECPVSNQYSAELNRLFAARPAGVDFLGVLFDPALDRAAASNYAAEFKLSFPVVLDTSLQLTDALKPTHVPQAFVLDRDGAVAYQGRIDDQFAAVGQRNAQVSSHDLASAMTAVAAGSVPTVAETAPVGCPIETPQIETYTYHRHVAPIVLARCAGCHRPGEVAPFSLLAYQDAAKRAQWISEQVSSRRMPPWPARDGFGHFRGARRLSAREIEVLSAWAKTGAAEGNPADEPTVAPPASDGWKLGTPDLVLTMTEAYTVPADGPDKFRFFVVPIPLEENQSVAAVEFRPGNPRVVHHAIMYLDASGQARKRDAADPLPGYEGFVTGGFRPAGMLGFWAPGYSPRFLPTGVARWLPKRSDLALQVHYHPSGKEETDQSQVAVYFSKQPVERYLSTLAMIDFDVDIPAGETRHKMEMSFTTPVELDLLNVTPHMHLIGTEMKVTATLPDGEVRSLVWVDWDFNWQDQFEYSAPQKLPPGTRLDLEAYFDNSSGNPANPNSPPVRMSLGEMTTDEMCICAFDHLSLIDESDRKKLGAAQREAMTKQMNNPKVMSNLLKLMGRGDPGASAEGRRQSLFGDDDEEAFPTGDQPGPETSRGASPSAN